jgi:hypothetical protein
MPLRRKKKAASILEAAFFMSGGGPVPFLIRPMSHDYPNDISALFHEIATY